MSRSFYFLILMTMVGIAPSVWATELLLNRSFETGDLTSWTASAGQGHVVSVSQNNDFSPNSPLDGSFFFSSSISDGAVSQTPEISIEQTIDLTGVSGIASGDATITAGGFAIGSPVSNSLDTVHIEVEFYQGGTLGTLLNSVATSPFDPPKGQWNPISLSSAVPNLTDTVVYRLVTLLDPGFSSIDVAVDQLSLDLATPEATSGDSSASAVPEPSSLLLLGLAGCFFGKLRSMKTDG